MDKVVESQLQDGGVSMKSVFYTAEKNRSPQRIDDQTEASTAIAVSKTKQHAKKHS